MHMIDVVYDLMIYFSLPFKNM